MSKLVGPKVNPRLRKPYSWFKENSDLSSDGWIEAVDTHTEGQATRIVTGGLSRLKGNTMVEKMEYFRANLDHLRTMLIAEPRGHKDMYGAVLTQPTTECADFGLFFMHNEGYMDMCGHATIGASTALVELGIATVQSPETHLVLETPGGLIRVRVSMAGGKPSDVCFRNIPAYVEQLDSDLQVPGIGNLKVDVAFGGNYFVFFSAEEVGLEVNADNIKEVVDAAMAIRDAANRQLPVRHSLSGNNRSIDIATVLAAPEQNKATYKNVHVFANRQYDRSPGGTGTSARLAVLHSKGELPMGGKVWVESLTGGLFKGQILEETLVGDRRGFVTEVTGSAYITGFHQFVADPEDRLQKGFLFVEV